MAYECIVIADSVSKTGVRLTTLQVTFPRFLLAELNTHRAFSRSSASSRAIPIDKRIKMVEDDPFIPEEFGKNKAGMQGGDAITGDSARAATKAWLNAMTCALTFASDLAKLGVHKQHAGRLLEPFLWHTAIITATDWENFFALRCHPDAQPEFQKTAKAMLACLEKSTPSQKHMGQWHTPLLPDLDDLKTEGFSEDQIARIAIARCARVSYLTHDGKRDPKADLALCDKLQARGHMSPFEHVAKIVWSQSNYGNFKAPWWQYRKTINHEENFGEIMNFGGRSDL